MSREDDLKFLQDDVMGKQNAIKFSNDFNDLDKLANGSFMFIVLSQGGLSTTGTANNPVFDPPNDEVGLYVKFNNRKYKVKLDEVS
tara:strand:- start:1259 stop:1516 length:258 start_codon:yes stop_codon:yes gene_type:complete